MTTGSGPAQGRLARLRSRTAAVFASRKLAVMLAFGFSAGLPFAMVLGTLNAWFGRAGVDLATIGILSWIGLAYAFKFLWSPAVNLRLPAVGGLGIRRGWILACQTVIAGGLLWIAMSDPVTGLGLMAMAAAAAAFASATQDIAIDAWRIEVADDDTPIELLSAIYQFGYRTAALLGGGIALILADIAGYPAIYLGGAALMVALMGATMLAPEPAAPRAGGAVALQDALPPVWRAAVLAAVLLAWAWAAFEIISFMVAAVAADRAPSARSFTTTYGPYIVLATVVVPAVLAGLIARFGGQALPGPGAQLPTGVAGLVDRLYSAIIAPLVELMGRLGLAALLVLVLILTYRFTDAVWGPFAFPFYQHLGYSDAEIGVASKLFGVVMTILGVALAAVVLLRVGRMATLVIGAAIAAASNLLFADLAVGAPVIDAVLRWTVLDQLFGMFGFDLRMARLMAAIAGENIAGGFAGAAFVAYLSALASQMHSAVQYAVFTSLALLVGTLGREWIGRQIEIEGYFTVFIWTALLGLIAVVACVLEWARQTWRPAGAARPAE